MEGNYDKSDKLIAAIHMLCKYRTITFYHVNEIPEILLQRKPRFPIVAPQFARID